MAHLVDVVEGGAFVGPVAVALLLSIFHQGGHHHDHGASVLPNHLHQNATVLDLTSDEPKHLQVFAFLTCQKSEMVCDSGPCVAM